MRSRRWKPPRRLALPEQSPDRARQGVAAESVAVVVVADPHLEVKVRSSLRVTGAADGSDRRPRFDHLTDGQRPDRGEMCVTRHDSLAVIDPDLPAAGPSCFIAGDTDRITATAPKRITHAIARTMRTCGYGTPGGWPFAAQLRPTSAGRPRRRSFPQLTGKPATAAPRAEMVTNERNCL